MLKTKKALGEKSKQLGDRNRLEIYKNLLKKSMSFTELLEETRIGSRTTLTKHLKELQKDGLIERSIDNRTYYAKKEEDLIVEELKRTLSLYELFATMVGREKFDAFLKDLAKDVVKYGEEKAFKKRIEEPSEKEEPVYLFTESKLRKLRNKYPEAIDELLKGVEEK